MTIDDIIRQAIQSQLHQSAIESFCDQEHITVEAFCDDFARHVASSYLAGRLGYEDADIAIAALFCHFDPVIPKFALAVFECFDAAEHGRIKGLDSDRIARLEVAKIVESMHGAS
jgi:hypothetical protein